jgi:hypothetical protein
MEPAYNYLKESLNQIFGLTTFQSEFNVVGEAMSSALNQ